MAGKYGNQFPIPTEITHNQKVDEVDKSQILGLAV